MKFLKLSFIISLVFLLSCSETQAPLPPQLIDLEFDGSLIFDGEDRTYFVHLPRDYSPSEKYPIVFVMHGGGTFGYEGVVAQSELSELSDEENFIVVYPEGIRTLGFRTWNAGDCCPAATTLKTDDAGFIVALLDKLGGELSINSKKVYAAGFSNGGQMAYKLANQFPDKFTAVASVAGVLQDFPYAPLRNVPIIHFHSYLDETAPYFGGLSDAPNIDFEFPSVEETLTSIANQYTCETIKETIFSDPATYDFFQYSDCENDVLIRLYVSHDGGHSWPGGQSFPNVETSMHFNASELMWDFFKTYELP